MGWELPCEEGFGASSTRVPVVRMHARSSPVCMHACVLSGGAEAPGRRALLRRVGLGAGVRRYVIGAPVLARVPAMLRRI